MRSGKAGVLRRCPAATSIKHDQQEPVQYSRRQPAASPTRQRAAPPAAGASAAANQPLPPTFRTS